MAGFGAFDRAQIDALSRGMDVLKTEGVVAAEPHLRAAVGGLDAELSVVACVAASHGFFAEEDFAAARQWIAMALEYAGEEKHPLGVTREEAEDFHSRLVSMFGGAPKTEPLMEALFSTQTPYSQAEQSQLASVPFNSETINGVKSGLADIGAKSITSAQDAYDGLSGHPDVTVDIVGTLIRDAKGRFGIKDETTGNVVAVDFDWSRDEVLGTLTKHLGKIVHASGTSKLWSGTCSMRVTGYQGPENGFTPANTRGGFRIVDARVNKAIEVARAGRWMA